MVVSSTDDKRPEHVLLLKALHQIGNCSVPLLGLDNSMATWPGSS